HPMKGHPGYQGDHTDYCIDIIKRVGSPNMKLLFDIYHVQIMDGDIITRLRQYKEYVGHIHTAGNPGRGELDETQEIFYPPIMKALLEIGYRDHVGQAATGTGKTAAFALPLLHRLAAKQGSGGRPFALVLVPTRELAMQVAEAVHRYGRALGASVLPIYGGQAYGPQLRALERGADVVIATPGRALDLVRGKKLKLEGIAVVVLDEADEMLD